MTRLTSIAFALLLIPAFGLGCNQREAPEPQIASSAGESGYAARFPSELSAARGELQTDESNLNMLTGKFPSYPAELDKPDWNRVLTVVDKADQAGRSESYVSRAGETQVVQRFFDEEKDEINKKAGGAAQYAAIQKGWAMVTGESGCSSGSPSGSPMRNSPAGRRTSFSVRPASKGMTFSRGPVGKSEIRSPKPEV